MIAAQSVNLYAKYHPYQGSGTTSKTERRTDVPLKPGPEKQNPGASEIRFLETVLYFCWKKKMLLPLGDVAIVPAVSFATD